MRLSFLNCTFRLIRLTARGINRYVPTPEARENIFTRIDELNPYLSELAGYNGAPDPLFSFNNLIWEPYIQNEDCFVFITFPDKTPTGKLSKYDAELHITALHKPAWYWYLKSDDGTHGGKSIIGSDYASAEMFYIKDRLSKARVMLWHTNKCFIVYLKIIDGFLTIWKMEIKKDGRFLTVKKIDNSKSISVYNFYKGYMEYNGELPDPKMVDFLM